MSFLRSWAYTIVAIVVLFTIIEMILPSGNIKKHVMFVMGIIVSITIAEPVLKLMKNDFSLEQVFNISDYTDIIYNDTYGNIISSQVNTLEKTFSQEILNKFNLEYPEHKIESCLVIFNKDEAGKIIDIERINIATYNKIGGIPEKVAKLCEVDVNKITIEFLDDTKEKEMNYIESNFTEN